MHSVDVTMIPHFVTALLLPSHQRLSGVLGAQAPPTISIYPSMDANFSFFSFLPISQTIPERGNFGEHKGLKNREEKNTFAL